MNRRKMILEIVKYLLQNKYFDFEMVKDTLSKEVLEKETDTDKVIKKMIEGYNLQPLIQSMGLSGWETMNENNQINPNFFDWRT
jgi:replication initiation and membrane attachment protein DnaB